MTLTAIRAAENIRSEANKMEVDAPRILRIAQSLISDWEANKFRSSYILFKTVDLGLLHRNHPEDKGKTNLHSVVRFHLYHLDLALQFLVFNRAITASTYKDPELDAPQEYTLVLEVRHPDHDCVAWINVETGKVHKTRPWLRDVDGKTVESGKPSIERLQFA